eukprot:scaffold42852_cov29-Tisochrysis_lutea.AAC.3
MARNRDADRGDRLWRIGEPGGDGDCHGVLLRRAESPGSCKDERGSGERGAERVWHTVGVYGGTGEDEESKSVKQTFDEEGDDGGRE